MISVSARKSQGVDIKGFLSRAYNYRIEDIDSVFGFTEFCVLYGGRPYFGAELSEDDIEFLYSSNIGYRIPLTNHTATREEFEASSDFLEKYHRKGNTIITTNNDLAKWIREDYPLYRLEASAIKKLDKLRKVEKALLVYDTVVLPASCNDDIELLESIKEKDRIRLFIKAGCAYTCPSRICYKSFSEHMRDKSTELLCSIPLKPRKYGKKIFDINQLKDLGYSKFKAVP